ncbi:MAG: hypothetical protein KGL39_07450 [Patescibacteria group bacterium]|nr:hypothetical protein [Patescibacteria group bacterium]
MSRKRSFGSWLAELEESVIQEEFGYEPGEFIVYPDHWLPLYEHGLSPRAAWQRALDMFACGRVEEECLHSILVARIAYEDGCRP